MAYIYYEKPFNQLPIDALYKFFILLAFSQLKIQPIEILFLAYLYYMDSTDPYKSGQEFDILTVKLINSKWKTIFRHKNSQRESIPLQIRQKICKYQSFSR